MNEDSEVTLRGGIAEAYEALASAKQAHAKQVARTKDFAAAYNDALALVSTAELELREAQRAFLDAVL